MSYNTVPTLVTGDPWSAANANIYWRDNFEAGVPAIIAAAGDIVYGTGPNAATVLSASPGRFPRWDAAGVTLEAVIPLLYNRQGGDATHWATGGTTNYNLTTAYPHVELGVIPVVIASSSASGQIQVNLSANFFGYPHINVSFEATVVDGYITSAYYGSVDVGSFYVYVRTSTAQSTDRTINVSWTATGY